jgi:hypothetical protein
MILSFSITCKLAIATNTADPLLTGMKTVTRRDWSEHTAKRWIAAYKRRSFIHQAWTTNPYVKGASQIGEFYLACEPYQERLGDMSETDVIAEGGFWSDRNHFIQDIGGGNPDKVLWVVRWDKFVTRPGYLSEAS